MSDIKPISFQEHARISITHHMIAGQKKNLAGGKLEAYVRRHATTGGDAEIFESELRAMLYPRISKPCGPKPRDLPGQQIMLDIAQPKRPRKPKREP